MADLWLPPGARRFDDALEAVIAAADDPAAAREAAEFLFEHGVSLPDPSKVGASLHPDSALVLNAEAWGTLTLPDGREPLAAIAKSDVLKRGVLDSTITVDSSGAVDRSYDNPFLDALCPALWLSLPGFQVFCSLTIPNPAPDDWKDTVQAQGFALIVGYADDDKTRSVYIASPPLDPAHGVVVKREGRKIGRNEKCPCASGIKFKHCCGR